MFSKLNLFKCFLIFVSLNFLFPVVLDAAIAYLNDWLQSFLLFSGLIVHFNGINQLDALVFIVEAVVLVSLVSNDQFFIRANGIYFMFIVTCFTFIITYFITYFTFIITYFIIYFTFIIIYFTFIIRFARSLISSGSLKQALFKLFIL